ncbi:MAG: hypothetical protein LWX56_10810 [Ignavibacteria bacterium]|nr:hypothetical protein [Ignavibacteria bacterium]
MVRREAYEKSGCLKRNIRYVADWEFGCSICRYYTVSFVPENLMVVYVQHPYVRMQEVNHYTGEQLYVMQEFHEYILKKYQKYFEK